MAEGGFTSGLFQAFINSLYSSGDISVSNDYHERCAEIYDMLDNDITGVVNTILDYSVNSASEANYRVECSEQTLQKLLNMWLDKINLDIKGIPTGLQALSKEYFKERWEGSSFCILRVKDWEKISVDNVTIEVPTTMWFVNGASIYVARPKTKIYTIGTDKYYLDKEEKKQIPETKNEEIIVQKPYNRWFDQYATPYLIRKGVYKNWLALKILQEKGDEVISKVLPYLFLIMKGDKDLFLQGDVNYSDDELKDLADNFKSEMAKYKNSKGKTPTNAIPFDTKYEHLIPDLRKILTEELYRQGFRSILSGLGFVDMLEISPSRQESRLNPKAFISETNNGVDGFKSILLEVIALIQDRNINKHPKLFSEKGKLLIVNTPLRINVDQLLDALRSGYDRGVLSIESYQEILGVDPATEKARRINEEKTGLNDICYPHVITNNEQYPNDPGKVSIQPAKPRTTKKENLENEDKKKNTPETKTKTAEVINAPIDPNLEIAPYDKDNPPAFLKKYPAGAIDVFITVFNESYPKGEDYAFPVAWTALKRWMKKNGYKKEGDKWVKSEE